MIEGFALKTRQLVSSLERRFKGNYNALVEKYGEGWIALNEEWKGIEDEVNVLYGSSIKDISRKVSETKFKPVILRPLEKSL